MKAWIVYYEDEWCSLVHAQTSGQAKAYIMNRIDPGNGFICFRAIRLAGLDDKPITYTNALEAGFQYRDYPDNKSPYDFPEVYFVNDCNCRICKPKENLERDWQELIDAQSPQG